MLKIEISLPRKHDKEEIIVFRVPGKKRQKIIKLKKVDFSDGKKCY